MRLGKEALAVAGVPAARDLAHQLEVLHLVLAHRNETGLVEQHVGRLEDGVVEQSRCDALLALRLVLELGLALELAEGRDPVRIEEPVQLAVLRDVRLHEHDALLGVEPRGEQTDRHLERALGQAGDVVGLRDGVQVHDAEKAVA